MTILKPLGFLALISLVLLLLIYILKPNFQQKFISSTYIWKLSLKYKKKKLPINKLKNILLIICQVLTLTILSAIIINPVKILKETVDNEFILILDTSASMRTEYEDETRFARAIDLMNEKIAEVLEGEGTVSVVIAAKTPYFLVERADVEQRYEIEQQLTEMKEQLKCSYGSVKLDDATALCEDILIDNPNAHFYFYTDLDIDYVPDGMTVVNVQKTAEYNISILNAYAEVIDNYYSFVVDVASYGRDETIELKLNIYGANAIPNSMPDGIDYEYTQNVDLSSDKTSRVIFTSAKMDESTEDEENTFIYNIPDLDRVFSFQSVFLSIDTEDCFEEDNTFNIYGGTKEVIKVLYASNNANTFWNGILYVLTDALQDRFELQVTEFKKVTSDNPVPNSGYDLYIYEHEMMPSEAPKDGVVIYSDPLADAGSSGFRLSSVVDLNRTSLPLTQEMEHPLLNNITADNITISRFNRMSSYDAGYETLMTCDSEPVMLVKNDENVKVLVMLFSLHYSNLPILIDFPILIYNVFEYFMPSTIEGNSFEVNDDVNIKSRSSELVVEGYDQVIATINTFPNTLSLELPGTYTITQNTYFGKEIVEEIFVKIPKEESNIFNSQETLTSRIPTVSLAEYIEDLLFIMSLALAGFVFLEWILKGNEGI